MIFTEQENHINGNNLNDSATAADDDDDQLKEPQQVQSEAATSHITKDELIRMLSERHILQLTPEEDELLDPIERTVRYIIPIPKYYYWDVLKEHANNNNIDSEATNTPTNSITPDQIPLTIKSWHTIIGLCDSIGTWTNKHIAQPIASYTGLTGPRFHEVISSMTPQELQQSQRIVHERQVRDQLHRQV
jgi:hypothetical protein